MNVQTNTVYYLHYTLLVLQLLVVKSYTFPKKLFRRNIRHTDFPSNRVNILSTNVPLVPSTCTAVNASQYWSWDTTLSCSAGSNWQSILPSAVTYKEQNKVNQITKDTPVAHKIIISLKSCSLVFFGWESSSFMHILRPYTCTSTPIL